MSDLARRFPPRKEGPGPLERPAPRLKKPPQPIRARNEKRAAERNAESFGEQAALCRRRPCSVPGCRNRPSVPHHTRSRGAGGGDDSCAPVCWEHHCHVHDQGLKAFEERFGVDLVEAAAQLAAELERKKGHDCEAHARLVEHEPSLTSRYRCTVCNYVLPDEQELP